MKKASWARTRGQQYDLAIRGAAAHQQTAVLEAARNNPATYTPTCKLQGLKGALYGGHIEHASQLFAEAGLPINTLASLGVLAAFAGKVSMLRWVQPQGISLSAKAGDKWLRNRLSPLFARDKYTAPSVTAYTGRV